NKRLHAFVDLEGIELTIWPGPEIGADSVGFDPLVALNDNGADGRRLSIGRSWRERHHAATQRTAPEDKAGEAQPSNKPPPKFHPRAPPRLCAPISPTRSLARQAPRRANSEP